MQFFSFVKKETYHIIRDKRTMLILLGMPIVQIILFGFAITTEVKNAKIAILDSSKDISTERIVNQLNASEYFTIAQKLDNPAEIDKEFQEGKISLAIVFGDQFNENLFHTGEASVQLIADATDPNQAAMRINYASAIIASYQQELMQQQAIPFQIIPEIKMLYNPHMKSAYNFVPGVMGMILMLICAMMTSIAIVREKEMGTMEVLLVSPMKPINVILSKAVPYFVLSLLNLTSILLLSVFVLDVPMSGSLFWLIILSFIFILVSLSLGLLISTIVDTQVAAMLLSGMALIMPIVLLSGMMFPIENMPVILQWFSNIIPARWYIAGVKKIMIEGLPAITALKEFIILLVMAAFFILLSLKKFKIRLE